MHRLSNKNIETLTADCEICGPGVALKRRHQGKGKFRWACAEHQTERARVADSRRVRSNRRPHRKAKLATLAGMTCERCGFVAEDVCQLDVDHKTRKTRGGQDVHENLWVLCANCHRLKTVRESKPSFDLASFIVL